MLLKSNWGRKIVTLEKIKDLGGSAAGVLVVLAVLTIPVLLLAGAAEISVWALDYIPDVIGLAFLVCVALVPFAIIPASRGLAGQMIGLAGLVFGVCLWLYTLAFTYIEWGMFAVVLGVLFAGIGVIFTGILAAIFSANWLVLGNIAVLVVLTFGGRLVGGLLVSSANMRKLRKLAEEKPAEVILTQRRRD